MATKQDIQKQGATEARIYNAAPDSGVTANPFRAGSWQHKAWQEGWDDTAYVAISAKPMDAPGCGELFTVKGLKYADYPTVPYTSANLAARKAEAGQGQTSNDFRAGPPNMLAPFPSRMPTPTREHINKLNQEALHTRDSTRALKLDAKIGKLYARWA